MYRVSDLVELSQHLGLIGGSKSKVEPRKLNLYRNLCRDFGIPFDWPSVIKKREDKGLWIFHEVKSGNYVGLDIETQLSFFDKLGDEKQSEYSYDIRYLLLRPKLQSLLDTIGFYEGDLSLPVPIMRSMDEFIFELIGSLHERVEMLDRDFFKCCFGVDKEFSEGGVGPSN